MKNLYLVAVLIIFAGSLNAAPYWGPGVAGTTYQEWNFSTPDALSAAVNVNNPYASGDIMGQIRPAAGGVNPTWNTDGTWSGVSFEFAVAALPNTSNTGPGTYKDIYIEIGYRGVIQASRVEADGTSSDALSSTSLGTYTLSNKEWKKQLDYFHLEPNPQEEYVCYGFNKVFSTDIQEIDYISISTRCVPEPASLCLLALGGLVLRRRAKKT